MSIRDHKIIQSDTFQGGLVTMMPAHLLTEGQTPNTQNVDFSASLGRLTKRKGHSLLVDGTGKGAATGLYEYIKANGTTVLYEVIGNTIYEVAASASYTSRYINATSIKQVSSITSVFGGDPPDYYQVTATAHGLTTGDSITFFGTHSGTLAHPASGSTYTITVTNANVFTLDSPLAPSFGATDTTPDFWFAKGPFTNIGFTNFTTFNNLCIAVSPAISTLKSTGGSFSVLLGTPPANGAFIESHKGRVFIANTSAGASRLHFCYLNNPEDWTTIAGATTDAGYIDVGLDDGDVITGIKSIGPVMVIFKNASTWILSGTNPLNFSVRKISNSVGCVGSRTIVACDTFVIFLSNQGVYAANQEGVTMLSYNIKPTLDVLSTTQRQRAAAGRLNTQYWLAIGSGDAGYNDIVYYLDYVYGVWGLYSNKVDNIYITRRDGTLLSGGSIVGHVWKHNDTTTDNGTAVTCFWETPDLDFDDWTRVKHPLDIILVAAPSSGKTIVVSHYVEGVAAAASLNFSLTASGSQDKVYLLKRHLPGTSYGRYVRFRFLNSETVTIQMYAYSIAAYTDERQNG